MEFTKVYCKFNEETRTITTPHVDFEGHPQGVGHLLFESMKKHFGKVAQIDVDTGIYTTFDELFEKSVRVAIHLKSLGVLPGDVVSICSHNQVDAFAAFIGITFIGAINASLDPSLSELDIEHLMCQVGPKILFVSSDCEEIIEKVVQKLDLAAKIVVFGGSERNIDFDEFTKKHADESTFEPHAVENLSDLFIIMFSSGSTGLPKGICLSHRYFLYHTQHWFFQVSMSVASLYWISSTTNLVVTTVKGTARACTKEFNCAKTWDDIEKYKIDVLQLPPFKAIEFVNMKPEGLESSLGTFFIGGGSTSLEHTLKIKQALSKSTIMVPFATTETGLLFNPLPPVSINKPLSLGVPFINTTFKIVDPETEETLGLNQQGELRVKSNYCFSGYYKKDSSEVWDSEGFFKTGDIGYFDEDFCFFIVDRIKEMFKYKGFHITPVKLEGVLMNHPDVQIAVIVGVPNPIDESHICAAVVPKKGSTVTPEELEKFFNDQVEERNKIRAGVRFLTSVPMTPTGKINRVAVKKLILGSSK